MRITVFSIGTQGDVRPFVALALGLQAQGHEVCIASGKSCEALVRRFGISYAPLTADFLEWMANDPKALQKGLNPLKFVRTARQALAEMSVDWAEQGLAAAKGADLLLGNGMVSVLAASLGESLSIPVVETHLQPVTPCGDIPPMMLKPPKRPLPGRLNLALYHSLRVLTWQMLSAAYSPLRRALGLDAIPWYGPYFRRDRVNHRLLYGFSPTLVTPSSSWPDSVRVAGNWFLDEGQNWQAPTKLAHFLATSPADSKPVYIGFGSMLSTETDEFSKIIYQAIKQSGQRAVVATGWGGLEASLLDDDDICVIDAAPHDWLLPQMSMAIHHGGVGTTAAALRAGIPSVVIPFFGDQPFWAWRLNQLGVAPPGLTRKNITVEQLLAAIHFNLDEAVVRRAAALGDQMRSEDGVRVAIDQLTAWGLLTSTAMESSQRDVKALS